MAEEQDKSQQTEEATPKRLEDARKKGQVPASKEPSTALAFLVLSLAAGSGILLWIGERMSAMMRRYLAGEIRLEATPAGMQTLLADIARETLIDIAPIALPVMLLGMLAAFLISGPVFSFEPLKPKLSKISPMKGLKRLFSSKSMAEFVKSVLKLALIGAVAGVVIAGMFPHMLAAALESPAEIAALAGLGGARIALITAVVFAFIAMADVLYQQWEHKKSLRMSKKEIRDEHKESEGDPQLKAKIRQIQMQQAQNRMMADVPKADVVITNPTRLAIALAWKPGSPGAPRVLAKGRGEIAARIREIAREHRIPIRENKPLARSLFAEVAIGHEIPEELYEAVAIVLAEIFRLQHQRQGAS